MGNRCYITMFLLLLPFGVTCDSRKGKPGASPVAARDSVEMARKVLRSELNRWKDSPSTLPFINDYGIPAYQRGLRVLDSAPAESLSVPELLTLSFSEPKPESVWMQVTWLEFRSDVHGVRVMDGDGEKHDYYIMDKTRVPEDALSAYGRLQVVVIPQGEGEAKDTSVIMNREVPSIKLPRRLLSQNLKGCLIYGNSQYTQPIPVWSLSEGQAKSTTTRPASAPAG